MEQQNELDFQTGGNLPSYNILPYNGESSYHSSILNPSDADKHLVYLQHKIPWENDEVFMFGKHIITARKTAWYGDEGLHYKYSGKTRTPLPWTSELLEIKRLVEEVAKTEYNSCLLNLYSDGDQGMGWHSDDEKELGDNPNIASVSLGAVRRFDFRHRSSREKISITLEHGSLLIMNGTTQHHWQHQIPKTKKVTTTRVNLTFRKIIS